MGRWLVQRQEGGLIHNPKEIDQFWNERARLLESVVREAIQNSLDARLDPDSMVEVRLDLRHLDEGQREALVSGYIDLIAEDQHGYGIPFIDHLREAGVHEEDWSPSTPCRVLVIEDRGTKGLEGAFDRAPDQAREPADYYNFMHGLGLTTKRGSTRGRHGLGKLAFPASSACRTFFAVTRRASDRELLLAGFALLRYRQFCRDGGLRSYGPGAWYGKRCGNSEFEGPVRGDEAKEFAANFGLDREESGLSLFVPWVPEDWDERQMIRSVLENYFVAIHAGGLAVRIGKQHVTSANIKDVCGVEAPDRIHILDFLDKALTLPDTAFHDVPPELFERDAQMMEGELGDLLARMEENFHRGEMVAVRIPMTARRRGGKPEQGVLRAFLQRPEGLEKGEALIVRDDLLLPDEARRFDGRRAFALLLIRNDPIAELLGDAENPAHRGWNASSEYLRERWKGAERVVRTARRVLPRLYDLLSRESVRDETVLAPFFPRPDRRVSPGEPARSTEEGAPPTREPLFRIEPARKGDRVGFRVRTGNATPGHWVVRVWYLDVDRRRHYDPLDFDLADSRFMVEGKNCVIERRSRNELVFRIDQGPYAILTVTGFDGRRDLHVDMTPIEGEQGK